jgi:serine/threonine protein kinase
MPNLTGQSIGRYHILEQLGEGGMATVYKAYDTRLERNVAVKVLRTDQFVPAQLQMVLQRFEREAKSLAKLSHPNIVNILDYGQYKRMPYLVMEYLPGGTLKQKLGHALPWQDAIRILLPVADGLSYAHQHGIIHRDVKPANILLKESGTPVLTDFGIAKLLEAGDGHTLTGSGVGIGTPEYMAPEQGIGAKTIDARADIYSLGIVLYEMVTGRKPYIADTPMAVVLKQMTDPLPRPADFVPDLPENMEHILFKALAKQPDDRYPDMNALIAAMESLLAEVPAVPVQTAPPTVVHTPAPQPEKKAPASPRFSPKMLMIASGAVALILIVVFGLPWLVNQFPAVPADTATPTSTDLAIVPTSTFTPPLPSATLEPSPTVTLTKTPWLSQTPTPLPAWVRNFAEPILAAIKDRAPDFQDDFSIDTGRWYDGYGFQKYLVIDKGVMCLLEGKYGISNYYFLHRPNIVLQVDVLLPINTHAAVTLASNAFDGPDPLKLQLERHNTWSVRLHSEDVIAEGTYQIDGQKTQLMYIVKGSRVAFFINQTPIAYYEYPKLLVDTKNERLLECGDTCYFDNVKFWNLDNIPNLP